jgi:hypothetical protein
MTAPPRSAALAGIGLMALGIFLFCCNDALGKWLLGTYSVWQMLLIRSIGADRAAVAVHLARGQGRHSRRRRGRGCRFSVSRSRSWNRSCSSGR